jgi:putative PIN family toxin of toxin-antitoxin system
MGKKPEEVIRVVLDTGVIISAMLFQGELSRMVTLWQRGRIIPVISRETFDELITVLKYPKFSLSSDEMKAMIENEILPFFEVVESDKGLRGVCRDPDDDKFISCAISARAKYVVSGDKDLSELKKYKTVKIITPAEFLRMFD